jgi:transcriptional regulator GlxA family with amidase domain
MNRTPCRPQHHWDALASRKEVVERAEAYVRAHMDNPVPLSALCRIVGIKERALRNAFYSVRGMSPKRSMLVERLEDVRRTLIDAGVRPTTVAGVATDHGFYELGRFAATYKKAFGETPSVTLRSARRTIAPRTQGEHGGHEC